MMKIHTQRERNHAHVQSCPSNEQMDIQDQDYTNQNHLATRHYHETQTYSVIEYNVIVS